MAKSKLHPQLEELKVSVVLFVVLIFIIVFLALFIHAVVNDPADAAPARVEQAIQKVGTLHPRKPL